MDIAGAPTGPVEQGEVVELHAVVLDSGQHDLEETSFTYRRIELTNTNAVLGDGPVLSTRDLPVGINEIELTVTDPDGGEATATVVIEVVEPHVADPS